MSKNCIKHHKKSFFEKYRLLIISAVALLLVFALVLGILYIVKYDEYMEYLENREEMEHPVFVPPSFDENAVIGDPADIEDAIKLGYSEMYDPAQMSYKGALCGMFIVNENNEADIYFANPEVNPVWVKLRVYAPDTNGEIVCETGLIRPGEYIKTVKFNREIKSGEKLTVKVMGYVPDTYMSAGSFVLVPYVMQEE